MATERMCDHPAMKNHDANMKMMEPKGARGMAAVKRLGRTKKTGGFAKIQQKAAKEYGSEAAGKRVAGAIYQKMVRAHNA